MRYLTVRNLPSDLARALEREKRRRGTSLNQTLLDLLRQSLGLTPGGRRSTGLAALAGTWDAAEEARFEAAIAPTEQVDVELWQ
jgi:plasmid stability protein